MTEPTSPQMIHTLSGSNPSYPGKPAGTVAWALGFLAYLPIPFLNLLIAGVAQFIAGRAQRKNGLLAEENGRRAANWGLTLISWTALFGLIVLLGHITGTPKTGPGEVGADLLPVFDVALIAMGVVYVILCLLQLIYSIGGTVQANRHQLVTLPVPPFIRS